MMMGTAGVILVASVLSCAAVLRGGHMHGQGQGLLSDMRPEVVHHLLVQVTHNWEQSAVEVMQHQVDDSQAYSEMEKSCLKVGNSVVQGSDGDYRRVKDYMAIVCASKATCQDNTLPCPDDSTATCQQFGHGVVAAMVGDSEFNRGHLDLSKFCRSFWQGAVQDIAKERKQQLDAQEVAAETKKAEETKVAAAKRAEEHKVAEAVLTKEESAESAAAKVVAEKAAAATTAEALAKEKGAAEQQAANLEQIEAQRLTQTENEVIMTKEKAAEEYAAEEKQLASEKVEAAEKAEAKKKQAEQQRAEVAANLMAQEKAEKAKEEEVKASQKLNQTRTPPVAAKVNHTTFGSAVVANTTAPVLGDDTKEQNVVATDDKNAEAAESEKFAFHGQNATTQHA